MTSRSLTTTTALAPRPVLSRSKSHLIPSKCADAPIPPSLLAKAPHLAGSEVGWQYEVTRGRGPTFTEVRTRSPTKHFSSLRRSFSPEGTNRPSTIPI
ncbi:hypothetical protein PILCRDRAFT_331840 [Piloderma croceum F 1598]|uniref:Uncharacterized protein n=1 Tax=Piloderma croceum (strain F 1598) TaxID=765440 RepID=A0A0C3FPF1_PILCF|nr:hypothetical protein PILCRDRAFT_331840 [Piloderma croceum F 1598]